jgi:hypothetical protein
MVCIKRLVAGRQDVVGLSEATPYGSRKPLSEAGGRQRETYRSLVRNGLALGARGQFAHVGLSWSEA